MKQKQVLLYANEHRFSLCMIWYELCLEKCMIYPVRAYRGKGVLSGTHWALATYDDDWMEQPYEACVTNSVSETDTNLWNVVNRGRSYWSLFTHPSLSLSLCDSFLCKSSYHLGTPSGLKKTKTCRVQFGFRFEIN